MASQAIITRGDWHRAAFTWDGVYRRLYVDDLLVAQDDHAGLADSSGGILIGAGKTMSPGTFFSGLIDDVRIYSRAIRP